MTIEKKKALVTMCFGDFEKIAKITHPSLKAYADKIGADFIVINEKKLSKKFIHYEKFQIYDMFKEYSRIMYIDTDVLVRPDCPDLFEKVKEFKLGIFNEGAYEDYLGVMKDACAKYKVNIPKWDRQSYNTGVMVLSRLHRQIFKKPEKEYSVYDGLSHYEQPYINLNIISKGYLVEDIGYHFNRMSIMDSITGEHRLSSYIVHYASAASVPERIKVIEEDLKSWEEHAPEYFYPKNVAVKVTAGLGDQIDAEPVIRYLKEKVYPKDNVVVKTNFPRVFEHLNVEIYDENKVYPGFKVYETLPEVESPVWKYLAQSLCHTTDFSSISVLGWMIPDIDKQIKLEASLKEAVSLLEIVGRRDLSKYVLVHPGKGWASKTFPKEYWQEIINTLAEKEVPTAIIGKYISENQGLVDLDCPQGVLDLRDNLDLGALIALISQSKILLSNDSAPVHIAGAFDNWIVLIPTCKHPDHVLPYRNGEKIYKTVSLYKKLVCDYIDSTPTMVEGQTIDYVKGDIIEYLPDVKEVIETIEDLRVIDKEECIYVR